MSDSEIVRGVLPDWAIKQCVGIEPFEPNRRRPGVISYGVSSMGYDIRLGSRFKAFNAAKAPFMRADPKDMRDEYYDHFEGPQYVIPPGAMVLGESVERFRVPKDVIGVALGKSTYARAGVNVHITPLEPGWEGILTIEITNNNQCPAVVYAGEGISQVLFFRAEIQPDVSYADKGGVYQNQAGLTLSRVAE